MTVKNKKIKKLLAHAGWPHLKQTFIVQKQQSDEVGSF